MEPTPEQPIETGKTRPMAHPDSGENDPHGGQQARPLRPDPDPISELATIDDSGNGGAADRPELARQPGSKPGFGPDEFTGARIEGNPDLGIDPRDAALRSENTPR